jgi:hypothetical protein
MSKKIYYFHYRPDKGRNNSGMTFAIRKNELHIEVAAAVCNPKDNFCKRIGRDIATGRLEKRCPQSFDNVTSMCDWIGFFTGCREFADHILYVCGNLRTE